jgi:glutathione S-transferase
MRIEGSNVADSTAIIARLEELYPEQPLYPASADERARALELEEWFDVNLGPAVRRWLFSELLADPESRRELALKQVEWAPITPPAAAAGAMVNAFVWLRYGVRPEADDALEGVVAALDHLEAELGSGSGEFLVGDRFSVADLTAAALFYPLVLPDESPWRPVHLPASVERCRASLAERPGYRWVEDVWARWRAGVRG